MAQFTNYLGDINEISKDTLFIDGSKIKSVANRCTFVWRKIIEKNMPKILKELPYFILKCEQNFDIKVIYKDKIRMCHLKNLKR